MSRLISHESPLSLLQESLKYNDYDYILVHLLEQEPEYLEFYSNNAKNGRRSIMDTSIFELGTAFNIEKYVKWVDEIKPTEYILPDVLEDCNQTINNSYNFKKNYHKDLTGKCIGVVQGKSYEEIKSCYKALDKVLNVDKIAISFDYSYYIRLFPHPNKWVSYMIGRVTLINKLLNDEVLNKSKPHHLLGCSNPIEFKFYKHSTYSFIESIDTSSPIVHGLHSVVYNEEIGNWNKVTVKLADLIKAVPTEEEKQIIFKNIELFRSYVD